ncbi:ATP-binding cassette domain-containing protein [Oceaniglobus trochenteri]|uniref:ATP-binding cassette domain-containing protein n=1 Tax=Oceaniglobus trochenteri TaxID=2763260 RepID=UPI001CFF8A0A|nr:ATP-binding cassette domain-containing protein [Oceaniglobus trochenteri]
MFKLREGVTFHNDAPMTPEAVFNALEIARSKPGPQASLPITGMMERDIEIVMTLSESRVETRALSNKSGDADLVFGLDPPSVKRLGMTDAVELLTTLMPGTKLLKMNTALPELSDPRARRDRPTLPLVAAALEQQFRAIGVELTINITSSSGIPADHAAGSLELGLVSRNCGTIPDPAGAISNRRKGEIEALLDRLGLRADLLVRRPDAVSGGEWQRLSLLRVLLRTPSFIFADEPTSRRGPITQERVIALLSETTERDGFALVLVSHDAALIRNAADTVLALEAPETESDPGTVLAECNVASPLH